MGCRCDPTQEEAQGGVAEEALFEQRPEGGEGTSSRLPPDTDGQAPRLCVLDESQGDRGACSQVN